MPVVPWESCERAVLDRGPAWLTDVPARIESTLGWPVIVKPCNLGSSAGVSTAASRDALIAVRGMKQGPDGFNHYHGIKTWYVHADGFIGRARLKRGLFAIPPPRK